MKEQDPRENPSGDNVVLKTLDQHVPQLRKSPSKREIE